MMVVNTVKAILKGDGKETIRGNWKKWVVNAMLNVGILLLVSGAFVKYNKLNNAASNADLKESIEKVLQSQTSFQNLNTIEHEAILFQSKQYTDKEIKASEEKDRLRFSELEIVISGFSSKQELMLQNQSILIEITRRQLDNSVKRLERLEDFHLQPYVD